MRDRTTRSGLDRLSSPSLVGRADELEMLVQAAVSPPALALVEGEAGIGKTRLVTELLSAPGLAGRRALVGQCQQVREPFPFGPVVDALRSLHTEKPRLHLSAVAGVVANLLPELGPFLPPRPPPSDDPAADQHRLWRALVELLGALGPTVLVLEDLHWADDTTAEFLRFLVSQQPPHLAVVLTYRRDDLSPESAIAAIGTRLPRVTHLARVHLDPLYAAEVRELIRAILASDRVSAEFAAYLHERTGGIPLAIEEVIHLLVDREDLVRLGGQWARRGLEELAVPHALRDSLLERVARLGPDARRVVRAAAVLGVAASEDMLGTVASLPGVRAHRALVEAVEFGVLLPAAGGYGFRHALATQAVYDAVSAPQRRELHERAAHAIEGSAPSSLGRLAHHYHSAERPRKWVRYAEAAADEAAAKGDFDSASRFLLEALAAPSLARASVARLGDKLGSAALHGLAHVDAIPAMRRALDTEGLALAERGRLRSDLAALLHQAGETSACYAEMTQAVAELRRHPLERCRAMAELAAPTVPGVALAEHQVWLKRALTLSERLGHPGARSAVMIAEATMLSALGDPLAHRIVTTLPASTPSEFVRACTNIAFHRIVTGHYEEADRLIRWGTHLCQEHETHRLTGALAVDGLLLRWARGQWVGLAAEIAGVEEASTGLPPSRFQAVLIRGLLSLAEGRTTEAAELLTQAQRSAYRTGAIPLVATAAAGLARAGLARGEVNRAVTAALGALEVVVEKGIWVWATDIAPVAIEGLVAMGGETEAAKLVEAFALGVVGADAPAAVAAVHLGRGVLAQRSAPGEAARWFGEAHDAWAALPRPYEAAQARERMGKALLADGSDGGVEALLDAVSAYEDLGATWDRDRAQLALRRHGVAVPGRRRGRVSYGNDLSPREAEVVELAVAGLSNAEIAERLFLSPRTIAHHLERAMRKRGVSSRKELRDTDDAR